MNHMEGKAFQAKVDTALTVLEQNNPDKYQLITENKIDIYAAKKEALEIKVLMEEEKQCILVPPYWTQAQINTGLFCTAQKIEESLTPSTH